MTEVRELTNLSNVISLIFKFLQILVCNGLDSCIHNRICIRYSVYSDSEILYYFSFDLF